ncbi:MAG: CusA/CzcA family heavy metal efflux RND transporter [Planctomycetota bacterium]|nr:CusA/CzcA family heavy metal efflux RND transporter [Planctomycetota bacterium]
MLEPLIRACLRSPLMVVVIGSIVMGAGIFSYQRMPVDAFPDVSPNLVQVFTVTEGLAPEEIEKYVTYPIEASLSGLPGTEKIRSVSNFGLSVVNVYFEDGMDTYFARRLVGERLQEAREEIPAGFGVPQMGPISTGMGLILFYYLEDTSGSHSLEKLRSIQDWIVKRHLQTVPGVTEVLGIGGDEKQFQVRVHPDALLRYEITLQELIEHVESNNLNVGAQFIEKNDEEFVVRSVGLAASIEDLQRIVVKSIDGRPIYLSALADVEIGSTARRGLQTHNGTGEVVSGMVVKLYGTNSSTVIHRVEEKLAEIEDILPDGIRIVPYYEQKSLVEACVSTVQTALFQEIGLVILVLLVFMGGLRPSIVVALSIPFSVLFSFVLMNYFGITANLMSLGGLAISIGMLVDGAIVMVENVDRRFRNSEQSKSSAVLSACCEVGRPISFAIAIIILVFLPLFTLQGVEGKMFRPLAYTVALAMAGSLLYALTLAPVLCSFVMKKSDPGTTTRENPVNRFFLGLYLPLLRFLVRKRSLAALLAVSLLAIGAITFPQLGSEFTPKLNEGTIVVRLTMAPSISLKESKRVTLLAEKRLVALADVREVVSRIGRGEVGAHADPINSAEMFVLLEPETGKAPEELERSLRKALEGVPGVGVNFTQPIQMNVDELLEGVRAELAIKLFGENLDVLKREADRIASVVSTVEGAVDIQVDQVSGTPQLLIRVNREAIARYGINVSQVQEVIRAAVGGHVAGQIFEGIRRYDILVRYQHQYRDTRESISAILVKTPDGVNVPLSDLVELKEIVGPRQITREQNQRFISIQCNVQGRDIGSFVEEAQAQIDERIDLPPGYLVTWGGQFRLQQEANKRLLLVIPMTLFGVFLLLFGSFNRMGNTLLILLNIPLALVGGVVALWLSGQNLSVPASVGFIALFGIALKNGMVLITCLDQLVREGIDIDEASVKGASMRLRPVLMTALTTALGLIPLLFATGSGSEVQRPLATVVVGGLATSTVLTLLVLPVLYRWFCGRSSDDGSSARM